MKRFLIVLLFLAQPLWVLADHPTPQLKQDWLRQAELRYTTMENGKVSPEEDAAGAVDGIITGKWGFHTAVEKAPYWQVDLGNSVPIEKIVIYNRCDIPGRCIDLYAAVSDDAVQ